MQLNNFLYRNDFEPFQCLLKIQPLKGMCWVSKTTKLSVLHFYYIANFFDYKIKTIRVILRSGSTILILSYMQMELLEAVSTIR